MKPQLAVNWVQERVQFPCIEEPKFDGVRGLYITERFTGRSLKTFKNKALTKFWSNPDFRGIDGELVLPDQPWNHPRQCSLITGLTGRIEDPTVPHLIAFDYLDSPSLPYKDRYKQLRLVVNHLTRKHGPFIHLVPARTVKNLDQLLEYDTEHLENGLEGTIIRNAFAPVKEGRSTIDGMELWRIKRFIDFEVTVTGFDPAMENRNEAKVNELGHTERSSHKANKVPKKMVGTIHGAVRTPVVYEGKVLFKPGMAVDVGPGRLTHKERGYYFAHPDKFIGKIAKVKTFPKGVLEKPRMPTFECFRNEEDMS